MKSSILRECLRFARKKNNPVAHPCYGKFVHFSFIVQDNKVLAVGYNRGQGYHSDYDVSVWGYPAHSMIHAEFDAYWKAAGIISDSPWEVVNIQLRKSGEAKISKPCASCYRFLSMMGCSSIHYSGENGEWKKVKADIVKAEAAFRSE